MSVYKRKGSPFYHYDFTYKGTRVRGSTDQTKKQLASVIEADLMMHARQRGVASILRDAPTLAEFSVEFLTWVAETHSIEKKTKACYENGWRLLLATKLAGMDMDSITNDDCETITFPGSNYNANQALSTLRRMFGKAVAMKRLAVAPKIKLRKVEGRTVAMTEDQGDLIAARLKGTPLDAFIILRATGMRPMECFSLRWEYVQWEQSYYRNPGGKTKSSRRPIPLLGRAMEILKRRHMCEGGPVQGWVFPAQSECGHTITINKEFTAARKAAGLPDKMVLYTARHGVGTDLASVVSLKTVMDALGHSDAKTAMGYQHPNTSGLQAKLDSRTNGRIQ